MESKPQVTKKSKVTVPPADEGEEMEELFEGATHAGDMATEHHQAAGEAAKKMLDHIRLAGELLADAKANCPPKQWKSWLADNVIFDDKTAEWYLNVGLAIGFAAVETQ